MKKKIAQYEARQGITAKELREILDGAKEQATGKASKVNKRFTKAIAFKMFLDSLATMKSDEIVDEYIATNILWEFGPDNEIEVAGILV